MRRRFQLLIGFLMVLCLFTVCSEMKSENGDRKAEDAREDVVAKMAVLDHVNLFLDRFANEGMDSGMQAVEDALDVSVYYAWKGRNQLTEREKKHLYKALKQTSAYRNEHPREYRGEPENIALQKEVDRVLERALSEEFSSHTSR
jgi:hypothetical protein